MRHFIALIFICLLTSVYTQNDLSGVWQGVLIQNGQKITDATIFYLRLDIQGQQVVGLSREEAYGTDLYAVHSLKGIKKNNGEVEFKQEVIKSKKSSSKQMWCLSVFAGAYNDSSGYLAGTYESSTCRRTSGKFILYRSKSKFSEGQLPVLGHAWRDLFLDDIKNGRNAPDIREEERKNFKFKPVYFDHDKSEIKVEYQRYLLDMIKVVNGHSDLRIQITGHTDAVGSESYNEGLSQRRAAAINLFFEQHGLDTKKLIIDFKGELDPVDSNTTPEGKSRNRRVDFKFI